MKKPQVFLLLPRGWKGLDMEGEDYEHQIKEEEKTLNKDENFHIWNPNCPVT